MAEPPQGMMHWPGISESINSGDFTVSHGVQPSRAIIRMDAQNELPAEIGTLRITFGNTEIEFIDCVLETVKERRSSTGLTMWDISILDRRWKWQFFQITGSYNRLKPNKEVDPDTEKTPQELLSLLLDALNETNYDISDVPESQRPTRYWDYANVDTELRSLCDELGCRVILRLDNTVKIAVVGVGDELPDLPDEESENTIAVAPSRRPDTLRVLMGSNRYQMKFLLEAVGLETDGRILPIESLSYVPTSTYKDNATGDIRTRQSWGTEDPEHFPNMLGEDGTGTVNIDGINLRELALETVFRWYRVKWTASSVVSILNGSSEDDQFPHLNGTLLLPESLAIDPEVDPNNQLVQLWQILPISDTLLDSYTDFDFGTDQTIDRRRKSFIHGIFYDKKHGTNATPIGARYRGSFSIDGELGVFQFAQPVYKIVDLDASNLEAAKTGNAVAFASQTLPAELYATCSFSFKDFETRVPFRHYVERRVPGRTNNTGPRLYRHDDIVRHEIVKYEDVLKGDPLVEEEITDNVEEVERKANTILDAAMKEYEITAGRTKTYDTIVKHDLDGAILQVTYSVGSKIARTVISRNTEHDLATPRYQDQLTADLRSSRSADAAKGSILLLYSIYKKQQEIAEASK